MIPEELKPNVGCFVTISADGTPVIDSGLYSDKPMQRRKAASPGGAEGNGEPVGDNKPKPLSQKLVDELAVQRRDILAINLASNPAIALDYMIFAIADAGHTYGSQAHGTTIRAPSPSLYLANYPESAGAQADGRYRAKRSTPAGPSTTAPSIASPPSARSTMMPRQAGSPTAPRAVSKPAWEHRANPASLARNRSISTIIWRA